MSRTNSNAVDAERGPCAVCGLPPAKKGDASNGSARHRNIASVGTAVERGPAFSKFSLKTLSTVNSMRWHPRSSGSGSRESESGPYDEDEEDRDDGDAAGGNVRGAASTVNGGEDSNAAAFKGECFDGLACERTVCGPDMVSGSMGRPRVHAGAGAGTETGAGSGGGGGGECE